MGVGAFVKGLRQISSFFLFTANTHLHNFAEHAVTSLTLNFINIHKDNSTVGKFELRGVSHSPHTLCSFKNKSKI